LRAVLGQQYDAAGQRTQLAATIGGTADFISDYVFDNLGRLDTLKQHGAGGGNAVAEKYADFAFNLAGQPTSLTRYHDLGGTQKVGRSSYLYDLAGRLTTIYQKRANDATFATYQYRYDQAGQITYNSTNYSGQTQSLLRQSP
jgi:beta-N-acetylglucosaminidase